MATEIFINTDLKDLTANAVANKNRPTQVVRLPQIIEGECLNVELSLVNSGGGYDTRSGDSGVALAVGVSAQGATATSGTFTLTAHTATTGPIAYNASAQAVEDALNALNAGTGAYGSLVAVTKLAAGSYRIVFDDPGARTEFGGTSIDLAPESEVTAATAVVGSATIRAQQVIQISQQPAIYTETFTTHANKFLFTLDANTARVQEFLSSGLDSYFEVKVDDDFICQVPIKILPAVAAPNSLPAHTLPSNIDAFAADPSTNGSFNPANWLNDLGSPEQYAVWGNITGTLSNQTDLQSALDAKAPKLNPQIEGTLQASNITPNGDSDLLIKTNDDSGNAITIQSGTHSTSSAGNINIKAGSGLGGGNIDFFNDTFHAVRIDSSSGFLAGGAGTPTLYVTKSTGSSTDKNRVSIGTGISPQATLDVGGDVKLSDFTSTSRSTDLSSLNPVQNYQPATDDTLAELCVDTAGNVVRGSQEATWTFTRAQLNTFIEGEAGRFTLLSSPGSGKCIVVEESNWLLTSDPTKTGSYLADLKVETEGVSIYSITTKLEKADMETLSGATFNGLGMYSRDVPASDKILKFDKPMTLRTVGYTAGGSAFPEKCISIKLKIKYRVFDSSTF